MSDNVTLKIDGKEATVPAGTNLIDAAETVGVHIPNLCALKGMKGIGACRMCLVEIEGMKAPMIACTTKAKEGMSINTKTEKVLEIRKFVIDLILSMHPLDCMTCTKAGVCTLQQYAYDFGIKESTFNRKSFHYAVDEANPFIKRDPDYCILCGRCVRVCKEQGTNVLEFMGRGVGSRVATAMDKPLQDSDCTFCGSCVDVCPVNALLEADRWRKGREWDYEKTASSCLSCGNACDIEISTNDGEVVKVSAGAEDGSVEKFICAIGRFGFSSAASDARVTVPMKKEGGKLVETTWEDAIKITADKLKAAASNAAIVSSGNILNEDAALLSKLSADVIKTTNVDTTVSLYSNADAMKSSADVSLDDADVIILAGISPNQWNRVIPALGAGIRKRVARGAKLIVLNESEPKIMSVATVTIKADEADALAHIAKGLINAGAEAVKDLSDAVSACAVTEEIEKAAAIISEAAAPVLFCAPALFAAANNLSMISSIKVVAVPYDANARGVVAAGLVSKGKSFSEMITGKSDVLYAIGELPVSSKPDTDFLIVQTSFMSDLAKEANLILPASTSLESYGTITSYLGQTKEVNGAIEPTGDSRQHADIFIDISTAMGSPLKASDAKSATPAASKAMFSPFEKTKGLEDIAAEVKSCGCAAELDHSRLAWLKEAEVTV
ncbi:MAG: molybdopterin-dependent oxidoreductase [Nitrospira sp.]|nr:molybdopterin-dependent oxidoreductase [Nitrospira sp.]